MKASAKLNELPNKNTPQNSKKGIDTSLRG